MFYKAEIRNIGIMFKKKRTGTQMFIPLSKLYLYEKKFRAAQLT